MSFSDRGQFGGDESHLEFTVVGVFETPSEAESAAEALRDRLGDKILSSAHLTTLDRLVFVSGPDIERGGMHPALRQIRRLGGRTLLEYDDEQKTVALFMTCQAPNEATASRVEAEVGKYFEASIYLNPRAPWEPDEPPEELPEDEARLRATLGLIHESWGLAMHDERLRELGREVLNPLYLLLPGRQEKLKQEARRLLQEALADNVHRLAGERGLVVDEDLLRDHNALQSAMSGLSWAYRPGRLTAITGYVERDGTGLAFDFVIFHRIASGLPAMLAYLREQGCTGFEYRLEDFDDVRED
jgi:hypothetical protein